MPDSVCSFTSVLSCSFAFIPAKEVAAYALAGLDIWICLFFAECQIL